MEREKEKEKNALGIERFVKRTKSHIRFFFVRNSRGPTIKIFLNFEPIGSFKSFLRGKRNNSLPYYNYGEESTNFLYSGFLYNYKV